VGLIAKERVDSLFVTNKGAPSLRRGLHGGHAFMLTPILLHVLELSRQVVGRCKTFDLVIFQRHLSFLWPHGGAWTPERHFASLHGRYLAPKSIAVSDLLAVSLLCQMCGEVDHVDSLHGNQSCA